MEKSDRVALQEYRRKVAKLVKDTCGRSMSFPDFCDEVEKDIERTENTEHYPGVECEHGYDACPVCDATEKTAEPQDDKKTLFGESFEECVEHLYEQYTGKRLSEPQPIETISHENPRIEGNTVVTDPRSEILSKAWAAFYTPWRNKINE